MNVFWSLCVRKLRGCFLENYLFKYFTNLIIKNDIKENVIKTNNKNVITPNQKLKFVISQAQPTVLLIPKLPPVEKPIIKKRAIKIKKE